MTEPTAPQWNANDDREKRLRDLDELMTLADDEITRLGVVAEQLGPVAEGSQTAHSELQQQILAVAAAVQALANIVAGIDARVAALEKKPKK